MRIYAPKRFAGGHLGNVFDSVMKSANKFVNSPMGRKLSNSAKKTVLSAGSNVLNNVLSGENIISIVSHA